VPEFVVAGAVKNSSVYVFELHQSGSRSGYGTLVADRSAVQVQPAPNGQGGNLTLQVEGADTGTYVAVDFTHTGGFTVSNLAYGGTGQSGIVAGGVFKTRHVVSPPAMFTAPSGSAGSSLAGAVATAFGAAPGTLNGPTCGSLAISQIGTDSTGHPILQASWTGCSQLVDGQFVVEVGAAPSPTGGNPFDNPQDVLGFWYGYVQQGSSGPEVVIDMGDHNTNVAPGDPDYYFPTDEWFDMSVFSSNVESPAGQLPEAPVAAALPLLLGAPVAWYAFKRRHAAS
jgi:hypothetical protein